MTVKPDQSKSPVKPGFCSDVCSIGEQSPSGLQIENPHRIFVDAFVSRDVYQRLRFCGFDGVVNDGRGCLVGRLFLANRCNMHIENHFALLLKSVRPDVVSAR
jgi:hypothetical protein